MRFGAISLINVTDVNNFKYATEVQATSGDGAVLYFQLIDANKNNQNDSAGLRYMPIAGSTLQVTFKNIDDAKAVTRIATQPFTQDPSIWSVPVLATDPISGTVNMGFVLSEPSGLTFTTKSVSVRAVFEAGVV